MGLSNEQQMSLADDLDARLRRETELEAVFAGAVPNWYGRLLSSLVLATGNAHVLYLSAAHIFDGRVFSLNVVLFTQNLYVRAAVSGTLGTATGDHADPVVTALPRSSLTSMRLSSDHDALDRGGSRAWPGAIRLTLVFARDLAVSLPLGVARTEAGEAELETLVTTSRAWLER